MFRIHRIGVVSAAGALVSRAREWACAEYLALVESYFEAGVDTDGMPVHREVVVVRNDGKCTHEAFA